MSTPPPPDRPTEPLRRPRPAPVVDERVVAPAPLVEERIAPVVDPSVILLRLEDAVDNLRTWLAIVGLVSVVALGVAIYAALDDDTSRTGGSTTGLASDERVSRIENRVDRLSRQLQDLRTDGGGGDDTAALAARVDELESAVKSQSGQGAASGTQDAVDELSSRIDDLAGDVEQLKQAQTP
jgi:outer membrane murein-binding lipoprotein Lpp